MRTMIIKDPSQLTHIGVWAPKWSGKYEGEGEQIILPAKFKVDLATPVVIIDITKYPPYKGLRLCMPRHEMQSYKIQLNGGKTKKGIECYRIPFSHLYRYDTVQEVKDTVNTLFFNKEMV